MIVPSPKMMPLIRAVLKRGQRVRLTVNGSSMLPFIHDGDVVELQAIHSLPKLGDIILARHPQSMECYVLHRVIGISGQEFFLRGDAQQYYEGPFRQSDVLGKVILSYYKGHARVMERCTWRLAGLLWTYHRPLGLRAFRLTSKIWRIGKRILRHPQQTT